MMNKLVAVRPVLLFVALGVLFFLVVPVVRADVVNGSFTTFDGWYSTGTSVVYDATVGNSALGSAKLNCSDWLVSSPVLLSGSSSFSYYTKNSGQQVLTVQVWDYDTGVSTTVDAPYLNLPNWTQRTVDLSGWSSHVVSVAFTFNCGALAWIDDVVLTNSDNSERSWSGEFSLFGGWSGESSHWSSSIGHDGAGSLVASDANSFYGFYSTTLIVRYSSWNVCYRAFGTNVAGSVVVRIYDVSGNNSPVTVLVNDSVSSTEWSCVSFSVSGWMSRRVAFSIAAKYVYVDDFCPSSGCSNALLTPTPTATSGVPATSTPLVFPTQLPYPTLLYGNGTAIPVYCPEPCQVEIANFTPVSFPTNVIIVTPTPSTATPDWDPGSVGGVVLGGVSRSYDTSSLSSSIPFGAHGSGSVQDVAGVKMDYQEVNICLPGAVSQAINVGGNGCASLPIWNVISYKIAGVDVLPIFGVIMSAVFVTFVIRQLQER